MTFCELREKDVINICDCKRLGCVSDLVFDPKNGCIQALVTSSNEKLWGLLGKDCEYEIPWCKIKQIGPDIILVELEPEKANSPIPHARIARPPSPTAFADSPAY